MKIILLIVIGLVGGVIGGMGMGGGTLLIPLLTLFAKMEQHSAQSLNLIAFVPMSAVALAIHIKNKLVDFKQVLWIALPAVAAGVGASYLSKMTAAHSLSRYFGIFLVAIGIYQMTAAIIGIVKTVKKRKRELLTVPKAQPRKISGIL